jgi:hypothetical protein
MFVPFFYHLRSRGLDVSPTEFLATLEALEVGLVGESLERFYAVGRALMVKRVEDYDVWDQAFAEFFADQPFTLKMPGGIDDEVLSWLEDARELLYMDPEELARLEALGLDELRRQFEERLREQTERHDEGSRWVGTGGTSPFGQGGQNPAGVRVGGEGGGGRAVQIAQARNFRNLRGDLKLDIRQMGVALRKLKDLSREGRQDELDLEGTIDRTARNAGDLELAWRAPRKNRVKLMLLMDVGGSMTPHARLCSRLFSAAKQASHFKELKSYYFHNCVYEHLYEDMSRRSRVRTQDVLREVGRDWLCVVVGDAAMAPYELMETGGAIDLYEMNLRPGIHWLGRIKEEVPRAVWLNPDPVGYWEVTYTVRRIREIYDMFPLTLDGLDESVRWLRSKRA